MRNISVLVLGLVLSAGASAAEPSGKPDVSTEETIAAAEAKIPRLTIREITMGAAAQCGDSMHQIRSTSDQPLPKREPASADKPYLIAAVGKTIDGCSVMQMHRGLGNFRGIPKASGNAQLIPALIPTATPKPIPEK